MSFESKERVLKAVNLQEPDRVPAGFAGINLTIDKKLKNHFGLGSDDNNKLFELLGIDTRCMSYPDYTGPKIHQDLPDRSVDTLWGTRCRWIENQSGGYWDYCDFPLKDADEQKIANWPMPDPDHFDYESLEKFCKANQQYAVIFGSPGYCDILNGTGMIRTMEQIYMDLALGDPAGLLYMKRRTKVQMGILERALDKAGKYIDIIWIGEDLGTQKAPLISMDLYRKHLKPIHKSFVDIAAAHNKPVMIHSCGSSSWVFPELIEMGIKVVDTLQPEAANMQPEYLKKTFGDKLCFHGCLSTGGPLAYGSVEDVKKCVRQTIEIMKPGGGFILAPTHEIQDNTPPENVIAAYEAVKEFGSYSKINS
jgi:uroporphyrinogen decarboxylase